MSSDDIIRAASVVAAAALLAAPYRAAIAGWLSQAAAAARQHGAIAARIAAAGLLIAAAWGKIPLPSLPAVAPRIAVDTPSVEMQRLVTPVAAALRGLGPVDRALWAQAWSKVALVVRGDAVTQEVAFSDTRALRLYTTLAIDIAWRRIGGHAPGSIAGLREAVEAAYGQAIGTDMVPVTADLRERYAAFCDAVAWAGLNGG